MNIQIKWKHCDILRDLANHYHCRDLGNIVTLIFIGNIDESNTTSRFLKSLAVVDTMTLIARIASLVFAWKQISMPYEYLTRDLVSNPFFNVSQMSERISKCLTVVIAFERVVAVTRPFRYKFLCTSVHAIVIIVWAVLSLLQCPSRI